MAKSLAQWRKERAELKAGVEQTLLSGLVVRMRAIDPEELLASGSIPDILTPLVLKSLYKSVREDVDAFVFDPREQANDTMKMIDSINFVCKVALIYPRVVDTPKAEDEISIGELSLSDRMWIFKLAFMPAEVLSRFRYEPSRDVEDSADGGTDIQQAEQVTEHSGQTSGLSA